MRLDGQGDLAVKFTLVGGLLKGKEKPLKEFLLNVLAALVARAAELIVTRWRSRRR